MKFIYLHTILLLFCQSLFAADSTAQQRINLHFQSTYIYQYKPGFTANYYGDNSLRSTEEKQNSITASMYLGIRLWKGAEMYINPELAGGSGLSGAFGLAGSSNGETFRVGNPEPTLYLGRAYLKQTIPIGTGTNNLDDQGNQLAGTEPKKYLRFLAGKYSLGDLFDNNVYSNSPRTQFLNWTLMNNGAWDYAANVRGYTLAFTTILQLKNTAYKIALATLPTVANGPKLNTDITDEYSVNAEATRSYTFKKRDGHIRLLGYYNSAHMGSYELALQRAAIYGGQPVVIDPSQNNTKIGFGISADQQLTDVTGVFARLGWNDGKNETWCFTESDRTVSAGISINGKNWKRKDDNLAFAIVANGLSQDHKNYLAAGGYGFQLGDGALNYAPETSAEIYYNFKPTIANGIWLTADYQLVLNPGYNADRGPAMVYSFRLHVEL